MKKLSMILVAVLVAVFSVPCLIQAQPRIIIEAPVPPPPPRVQVVFPLPPPIVFAEPPEVMVLPETEVYVVPSVPQDLYFYNGFWFRLWEGRWYRSQYYDRGWGFYRGVPGWYGGVYPGWRDNYRTHMWGGNPWTYRHIPHNDFQRNWRGWHQNHYWKDRQHWGTEGKHHHGGDLHHKGEHHKGDYGKGGPHGKGDYGKGGSTKGGADGKLNKGGTTGGYGTKGGTTGNLNKGGTTGGYGTKGGTTGTKQYDKAGTSGTKQITKSPSGTGTKSGTVHQGGAVEKK